MHKTLRGLSGIAEPEVNFFELELSQKVWSTAFWHLFHLCEDSIICWKQIYVAGELAAENRRSEVLYVGNRVTMIKIYSVECPVVSKCSAVATGLG